MDNPEVPPFFICPISLITMKDPVTISTGMTFDRESIQKWLFTYKNQRCPITNQLLTDYTLTPNSTLLRLIQSWLINNKSKPSKKIHSPKPTTDFSLLLHNLIEEREPNLQIKSLRNIKSLIKEDSISKTHFEESRFASILASLITKNDHPQEISEFSVAEEATTLLNLLKPSNETLKKVSEEKNGFLIQSLSMMLQNGSYQATLLLESILKVVDDIYKIGLKMELFEGITDILKDQNSKQTTMAVLSILMEVIPLGRNRLYLIKAGLVSVLVELLAESNEKKYCEIMLGVIEELCGTVEGRSAFLGHPASIAMVVSKILMVSYIADERALMVLSLVCRFCKSNGVAQEIIEVGGVDKLCMILQVETSMRTKEKAKEIIVVHLKAWRSSPCFPS